MAAPKKTATRKVKSEFEKKVENALATWADVLYINRNKEDWRTNEATAKALWGDDFEKVEKQRNSK